MDNTIKYLLEHTDIDIVALLLAIIGGILWAIRKARKKINNDDASSITIDNSSDVAINNSIIDKSKK